MKRRSCIVLLAILTMVAGAGCATGYVEDAARTSLSSFVISIFSTAVADTVNP